MPHFRDEPAAAVENVMSIVFRRRAAYPRRHVDRRGDQAVRARSRGAPLPLPVLRPGAGRAAGGLRPGDRVLAGDPLRRHRARRPGPPDLLVDHADRAGARPPADRCRAWPCWPTSPSWPRGSSTAARRYEGAAVGRPSRPRAPAQAGQPGLHPAEGQGPGAPDPEVAEPARRRLRRPGVEAELVHDYGVLLPADHHRRVPRRGGRRAPPVQALVGRLRGCHRQPRHEPRRSCARSCCPRTSSTSTSARRWPSGGRSRSPT